MTMPPGPRGRVSLETFEWIFRPEEVFDRCYRRYGDSFTLNLLGVGRTACFSAPDAIRQLFTGPPDSFLAGEGAAFLEPVIGPNSLVRLDGDAHHRQRRVLMPPFVGERMRAYTDIMYKETLARLEQVQVGRPTLSHPLFQDITMAVMLRAVFGMQVGTQLQHLDAQFRELLRIAAMPVVLLIPAMQINLGPRSPWGRFLAVRDEVDRLIYALIASRRARGDAAEQQDVLSLLLTATHEDGRPLNDQELRDALVTVLAGGFDTSANSLAWALGLLLSEPPQSLAQLRAELDENLGDAPVNSTVLPRLPYLEAVLKESMRLHPVVPLLMRRLSKPTEIGGYELPAGTMAAPLVYLAHRREALYPEPERFRPERFLAGDPDPYAFIPFGRGVRRCLGMAFAMHEMKVVLATILQRMEVRLAQRGPLRSQRSGPIMVPAGGVPVIFTPRRPRATTGIAQAGAATP